MLSNAFPIPKSKAIPVKVGTQTPLRYKTNAIHNKLYLLPPIQKACNLFSQAHKTHCQKHSAMRTKHKSQEEA